MTANASNVKLRQPLGRPLTYEELDANFQELINIIEESQADDVLNKLDATVDPTVTNDSSEGYEPRSLWFNIATYEVFRCMSAEVGAAIWVKTTLTIDELGSAATFNVGSLPNELTTNERADQISADNSIVYAIALG